MTHKEKAKELVNKFLQIYDGRVPQAKQCTLICVDEILEFHDRIDVKYWNEVKQEINKL
jgi:hypothetical protein